jgi:extracellular factor (EF) 3-hydroxypalmitic acid methyl ester biosynthesis protein
MPAKRTETTSEASGPPDPNAVLTARAAPASSGATTPRPEICRRQLTSAHGDFIRWLAQKGGPEPEDYPRFDAWLGQTYAEVQAGKIRVEEIHGLWRALGEKYLCGTIQGLCLRRTYGYAGDFDIMDKLYTSWTGKDPRFEGWDHFAHLQAGAVAVRNRLSYFLKHLASAESEDPNGAIRILNLGCGPCRDVHDHFRECPQSKLIITCVDHDERAIRHAQCLCHEFSERVEFHQANALRFKTEPAQFRLIWCAGLFDYLSDRAFARLLRQLLALVMAEGEIVIANFSTENPSRAYMELVCNWQLYYRGAGQLIELAVASGANRCDLDVRSEPLGVIHFLHIKIKKTT